MSFALRLACPLILSLLSLPSAHAAQFCVGTGAQFADALNAARANDQHDEIRIRANELTRSGVAADAPRWSSHLRRRTWSAI